MVECTRTTLNTPWPQIRQDTAENKKHIIWYIFTKLCVISDKPGCQEMLQLLVQSLIFLTALQQAKSLAFRSNQRSVEQCTAIQQPSIESTGICQYTLDYIHNSVCTFTMPITTRKQNIVVTSIRSNALIANRDTPIWPPVKHCVDPFTYHLYITEIWWKFDNREWSCQFTHRWEFSITR